MSAPATRDGGSTPGDTTAFDAMVRAHYARLCNFAIRFVASRDVAEDIVQEVFVRIWQRQTDFTLGDPLPYLYQAVRNRAANHTRDQHIRQRWRQMVEDEAAAAELAGAPPAAADVTGAAEVADAIDRAINALPERCRQIFTMSREQDLTYSEIARILGLSIKTVETQMGRALKSLRAQLADYLSLAIAVGAASRWLS